MDVVGAYLNSELDKDIYMCQPPGFDDGSGRVFHLRKALYGLKQAGTSSSMQSLLTNSVSYTFTWILVSTFVEKVMSSL